MHADLARKARAMLLLTSLAALMVPWSGASAAKPKSIAPGVAAHAWYWEEQTSQPVTDPTTDADVLTLEAPNPFCPQAPGSLGGQDATCEVGRLPIEVRNGDYESPNMVSAVGFDLSGVPFGATVTGFSVTFLEANDEQSQPINPEGKKLQACTVTDYFGDGEAREYKERPKFKCSKKDATASRKATKGGGGFEWTFDLTTLAKGWVKNGAPVTAVLLSAAKPKDASAPGADLDWRIVLAGSEEDKAIITKLSYILPTPANDSSDDDSDDGGPTPATTTPGTYTPGTTTYTPGTTPPTGTSSTTVGETTTPEPVAAPEAAPATEAASAEIPEVPGGLPGYAWLAILGGMAGFSLVRSVVLEGATGARPGGVLAQIRTINSERRGAPIEDIIETTDGRFKSAVSAIGVAGRKSIGFVQKIDPRSWRKR